MAEIFVIEPDKGFLEVGAKSALTSVHPVPGCPNTEVEIRCSAMEKDGLAGTWYTVFLVLGAGTDDAVWHQIWVTTEKHVARGIAEAVGRTAQLTL